MATTRGEVSRRLGAPTEQLGSVNDPRTVDEFGVRWNEKWLYRDPEGDGRDLVALFHRYDFLGLWRIERDGSAEAEKLPEG